MFKGFFVALLIGFSQFLHGGQLIDCKKPDGHVVRVSRDDCRENRWPTPTPTHKPTPTATPKPTRKPTPTPKIRPTITDVNVRECSTGSSCYKWLTNIEVTGKGFAEDTRARLHLNTPPGGDFTGHYVGGDGMTKILTDFTDLPHCGHYDVIVYGSTGTATAVNIVATMCP